MLETTTITQTVIIPAKPVQVYDAFVNSKKHEAFTGAKATGARRIVQQWQTSEWPEGYRASKLEFTFEEADGGTKVTMVHSDVPSSQAEAYRQGWFDYYWTPLQEYFS